MKKANSCLKLNKNLMQGQRIQQQINSMNRAQSKSTSRSRKGSSNNNGGVRS